MLLASLVQSPEVTTLHAYREFLTQLLEDAGNPTDPVQRMLIEQFALAHFRLAQLQERAAVAKGVEAVRILSGCATRLMGEYRKLALCLQQRQIIVTQSTPKATRLRIAKAG